LLKITNVKRDHWLNGCRLELSTFENHRQPGRKSDVVFAAEIQRGHLWPRWTASFNLCV